MKFKDWIDCTGDSCKGDIIKFTETVFSGRKYKPFALGDREIIGKVIRESYGEKTAQHTFVIEVILSSGHQPPAAGAKIRRKGRNVYRNGTSRQPWTDESERVAVLDEKHKRGAEAREFRNLYRD